MAREQARKDLPLSTYTEAYWKVDLHNLLHFLALRMDSHAQWEIRQYATTIGQQIVGRCFRWSGRRSSITGWRAMFLSRLDRKLIARLVEHLAAAGRSQASEDDFLAVQDPSWADLKRCRERDECREKLRELRSAVMTVRRRADPCRRRDELLELNQRLLESIAGGDWETYEELCDPTLTAFEPEGRGHLIEGMAFHRFYFDLGPAEGPRTTTMASPAVRLMGDVAVVTYVRLVQSAARSGPTTSHFEETRVWQMQQGRWRHVHFHRSRCE